MVSNLISLYKKLDDKIIEKLKCKVITTQFLYTEDHDWLHLTLDNEDEDEDEDQAYYLGNATEYWDPNIHDLKIKRILKIEYPSALFGNDSLAPHENELGIGAHFYSRNSSFQQTFPLNITLKSGMGTTEVLLQKCFPPSNLRGEIFVDIFIYLKNSKISNPYVASTVGMNLGIIDSFKFIVDGEGSMFPIVEVERPGEPLWRLEMSWTDVNSDSFDADNIRLEFNIKHPLYENIYKSTKSAKYLLTEVFANALSQIIYKVMEDQDFEPRDTEIPDSIATVVSYWIQTYEVNVNSLEKINYSLRKTLEKIFL